MSNLKIYTENPFVDELVYYVKLIAPNCVIKNETEANANETVTSLQNSDLYIACYEGRAIYDLIPRFPIEVLAAAGVPAYLQEDYFLHKDHIPSSYHETLTKEFMKYNVEHYEEQNNYYRMLIGLPKLSYSKKRDTIDDLDDYVFLTEDLIPEGLVVDLTIPIHLQPSEIIDTLDSAGVLDTLVEMYPDKPYLKYLTKRIDIYQARIAVRFQLLYAPNCGSDIVDDKWKNKYELNRDYILRTVYSDAFKFQSEYYDNIITILIILQTMVDIIGEVQENIARKDVFDARCVKYIFLSYGVPFYDIIPLKYQIKMMKNLNNLLKYKSTPTCMLDLCTIFGFDSVNVFKYYLLRNRKFDDNGDYIFTYEKGEAVYKDTSHPINSKTIISKSSDCLSVTIPYPFPQYKDKGNIFRVFVGEYIVYEGTSGNTYFLNGNTLVFNQPEILKYDIIARYDLTEAAIERGYELKSDGLYRNDKMQYSMAEVFENFDKLLKDNIFEQNASGDIYKYQTEERMEYSYGEPVVYRNIKFIFYFTDEVVEYPTKNDFPIIGETGKIYVAKDTNKSYRWSGKDYREEKIDTIDTTDFPINTELITATISNNGRISQIAVPSGFTKDNGLINVCINSTWLHPSQYTIELYNPLTIVINYYNPEDIAGHEAVILFMYTAKYNIHPTKQTVEQEKDSPSIKMPVPIANYSSAGHEFLATYDGTILSPNRYTTMNDTMTMIDNTDTIGAKHDVTYNFMYIDHEDPTYIILRQKLKVNTIGQRSFTIEVPSETSKGLWEVYDDKNDPLEVKSPVKYSESPYQVWSRLGVSTLSDYQNKLYQLYVLHDDQRFYDYQYNITKNILTFTDSSIPLEQGTYVIVEFRFPRDPNNSDIFKKDIYDVSFIQTTYDKQRIFKMMWPYNKFVERGNKFYVQINGRILLSNAYDLNLTTNTLTIFSVKDALSMNSELTICYYYRKMNEYNIIYRQTMATALTDATKNFIITFPFDDFYNKMGLDVTKQSDLKKGFFVTVGGVLLSPSRYTINHTKTETTLVLNDEKELDARYTLTENAISNGYEMKSDGLYLYSKFLYSWYDVIEKPELMSLFEESETGLLYAYHYIGSTKTRLVYGSFSTTPIIGQGRRVIFNFVYHSIFGINSNYVNNTIKYVNVSSQYMADTALTIPYPYPGFLEDADSTMHVSINTHVIEPVNYDIHDGKIYIDRLSYLLIQYGTNQVTFDFINSKATVYEVLKEVNDKSYKLSFVKAPLDGNLDDYMRNDENYLDYNTLTSGDKLWRGDNTAEYVQNQILNTDFTYMRTKYISIDDIQNMANLFLDLPYFFTIFFDNVKLENKLLVQLYSIKPGTNFRLNDTLVFMIIMAFEYNNIEDTITRNLAGILYLRGFNFRTDVNLLKEDIANNSFHHEYIKLNSFNVWANMYNFIYTDDGVVQLNLDNYHQYLGKTVGMDKYNNNYLYGSADDDPEGQLPEWHAFLKIDKLLDEFIIPKKVISTYEYLLQIYSTDKRIMKYVTERMYQANSKHDYAIYKKIYDALMKLKYTREFFVNAQGTGYCDTYSEFLQYRNATLYNVVVNARLMEDEEKRAYILDIMSKVIKEVSEYLDSDEYKYLFSKFPGSNTDAVKTYIKLMINFFKSYKVELTGINTIFTLDNRAENSVRPIDVINKLKSIHEPRTDVILKETTNTTISATKNDIINIDDMIYMYEEITINEENIDDCYGKHLAAYYEDDTLTEVMPYVVLTKSNISNYLNKRVKLKIH